MTPGTPIHINPNPLYTGESLPLLSFGKTTKVFASFQLRINLADAQGGTPTPMEVAPEPAGANMTVVVEATHRAEDAANIVEEITSPLVRSPHFVWEFFTDSMARF
jgi:hypothetical protein